jgi:hypothetical protein
MTAARRVLAWLLAAELAVLTVTGIALYVRYLPTFVEPSGRAGNTLRYEGPHDLHRWTSTAFLLTAVAAMVLHLAVAPRRRAA